MKKKFWSLLIIAILFGGCERKVQDPTYHDPVLTENLQEPQKENFSSDQEYQNAMVAYKEEVERLTKRSLGLNFNGPSCLQGACNRVNKPNANVQALSDAPSYNHQLDLHLSE